MAWRWLAWRRMERRTLIDEDKNDEEVVKIA